MKKFLTYFVLFIVLLLLIPLLYFQFSDCGISPLSCGDYTTTGTPKTQKVPVGSGPEDIALDLSQGTPRFIVSCDERRQGQPDIGAFYGIDPTDNSSFEFKIIPEDFTVHPHGIDIVTIDSIPYLYAISHEKEDQNFKHRVYRFVIQKDSLLFDSEHVMENELMRVPNDLDVLEDGSFYASNSVPTEGPNESTKAILGIGTGSVVHYDGKGNWEIVLADMCYPNGVWVNQQEGYLLVANGGCQEVVRYKINDGKVDATDKLSTKKYGMNIPIGDNLMLDNDGKIWTAAHPCPLKFLDHAKDIKEKSPMQVFEIDPTTLKPNMAFQNNGDLISAASTVLKFENKLYIAQVFDPFVLVVADF